MREKTIKSSSDYDRGWKENDEWLDSRFFCKKLKYRHAQN
jgi:hypothetical protein